MSEMVPIQIDFSDEELFRYMKLAHEMDITLNQLINRALSEMIEHFDLMEKDNHENLDR
jgi:hypothetical protein